MKTGTVEQLNPEQMEHITGAIYVTWFDRDQTRCRHNQKEKTGRIKVEEYDWFFFTTRNVLREYQCPECGKTFWD